MLLTPDGSAFAVFILLYHNGPLTAFVSQMIYVFWLALDSHQHTDDENLAIVRTELQNQVVKLWVNVVNEWLKPRALNNFTLMRLILVLLLEK